MTWAIGACLCGVVLVGVGIMAKLEELTNAVIGVRKTITAQAGFLVRALVEPPVIAVRRGSVADMEIVRGQAQVPGAVIHFDCPDDLRVLERRLLVVRQEDCE